MPIHLPGEVAQASQMLREWFKQFRILILGRANAGKTTILQKVCNTDEQPHIYDAHGNKIDGAVIEPSSKRGCHDIESAMIFKSNSGFVFHDSRGFEAGGASELSVVKDFITRRAREKNVDHQLHAIWYCIPVDNSRPITAAERSFFSECGTGKVPVVVVFTKMDALDSQSWIELVEEKNISEDEARKRAPGYSLSVVEDHYLPELLKMRYPPKGIVYMRYMNQESTTCKKLIEETVAVLDDSNLQLLLVSTQQVSIEICVKYALSEWMNKVLKLEKGQTETLLTTQGMEILKWFPQVVCKVQA